MMSDDRLPSTEQLLVEGGDARICLDPRHATNRYGCPARPDAQLLALGSSTASVISPSGFAAADALRERLRQTLAGVAVAERSHHLKHHYALEMARMRCELLALCLPGSTVAPDVIFAASGTDLHRIAARLTGQAATQSAPDDSRACIVTIDAAETGSQVPAALCGEPSAGDGGQAELISVAVREADGRPRPAALVDAEVSARVSGAIDQGRRVVLVAVDVTKTGLLAPSPACAMLLKQRYGARLDVMVDACQYRLAPTTVNAYLMQDFMVALTGSKFMGGPSFSGALLLPPGLAARQKQRPVPATLAAFSKRAEWPADWDVQALPDEANLGLALRWEAALAEQRAFVALPASEISKVLAAFADALRQRLATDHLFSPVAAPPLDRHGLVAAPEWDAQQTIFPFLLRDPAGRHLAPAQTTRIWQGLLAGEGGVRYQLGQPVACSGHDGQRLSALRLCSSARLIIEAAASPQALKRVIDQALEALESAARLVRMGC